MIQSGPQTIISQGADWRFLNLMVPHSVPSVDDFFQDRTRSDKKHFHRALQSVACRSLPASYLKESSTVRARQILCMLWRRKSLCQLASVPSRPHDVSSVINFRGMRQTSWQHRLRDNP
jgi:hypothetical protein